MTAKRLRSGVSAVGEFLLQHPIEKDVCSRHVEAVHTTIEALGLRNVQIRHGSIVDIDEGWGRFDYIICHGVFSWVDADVQRAILRVAHDNLAEHGVAYVSYNTYPGWHMRESVRHMMRYHAGRFDEIPEQIEQARALLTFLGSAVEDEGAYGQLLAREIERQHADDRRGAMLDPDAGRQPLPRHSAVDGTHHLNAVVGAPVDQGHQHRSVRLDDAVAPRG